LDHADAFHLFGSMAIKCRFQYSRNRLRHGQGQEQAHNECAPPESAKKKRGERDRNEQGLPNFAVAKRGHEQVERRTRPFFVDEMEERLVHADGRNKAAFKF
jgi:hypothetical protein